MTVSVTQAAVKIRNAAPIGNRPLGGVGLQRITAEKAVVLLAAFKVQFLIKICRTDIFDLNGNLLLILVEINIAVGCDTDDIPYLLRKAFRRHVKVYGIKALTVLVQF